MSQEQTQAFIKKVQIEPSLQEQLKSEGGTGAAPEAIVAIAKSAGFEINVEDVKRRRRTKSFLDKVQIDPSLQEQLEGKGDDPIAIVEVAKAAGFEINVEDVVAYQNRELTDEELEMVSGGSKGNNRPRSGGFDGGNGQPWSADPDSHMRGAGMRAALEGAWGYPGL
ncbi:MULTISPECIES: Nif11-like leader peptide family RiPP precursor [unclassified Prochlorococcus]|uniref:Nif11-like leader peptide family RiPP precursor n=1 Tax=unclassified Prochlorococcus TaxID=2627481 RepID=UPI0005339385|nr:hypothetical protein EV12_1410 [Prochlorococcus sp. MIT 0701]KGG28879.1 hypothetical protein EV13_1392 [Prochlorococcus sp. MIT 0702]KGG37189.1 hypothetical protein EV14_0132 [Prochlorococcus sp. MIT 0703]